MIGNYLKHYNDFESTGKLVNLSIIKRIYKSRVIDTINSRYFIIFVYQDNQQDNFMFTEEFTRDTYFDHLMNLITIDIFV